MLRKMTQHCGPWYVLEHVRPFPGVSIERLLLQIRRAVLTPTTIVRGPTTCHQWRFAAETPVLSKYLGCCWACQANVLWSDHRCPECRRDLNGGFAAIAAEADEAAGKIAAAAERAAAERAAAEARRAGTTAGDGDDFAAPPPVELGEIDRLREAVSAVILARRPLRTARPATVGRLRVSWIVGGLMVLTVAAVFIVVRVRSVSSTAPGDGPASPKPGVVTPTETSKPPLEASGGPAAGQAAPTGPQGPTPEASPDPSGSAPNEGAGAETDPDAPEAAPDPSDEPAEPPAESTP